MPIRGAAKGRRTASSKSKAKQQAKGNLHGAKAQDFWEYKHVESAAIEDEAEVKEMLQNESQPELAAVIRATVGRELQHGEMQVPRDAFEEYLTKLEKQRALCWQLPFTLLYFVFYTYTVLDHENLKNTAMQERMIMSNVPENGWGGVDEHFPVSGHYEMMDISEIGELWQYLHEAVIESLIPDMAETAESDVRRVFRYNQLVGGIQLQQIRRQAKLCAEAYPNLGPKSARSGKNPLIKDVVCYPADEYTNECFGPGKNASSPEAKAGFCSDTWIKAQQRSADEKAREEERKSQVESFADDAEDEARRLADERQRLNEESRQARTAASAPSTGIVGHFPRLARRLFSDSSVPGVRGKYLSALTGSSFGGGVYSLLYHEHEGLNAVTSKLRALEEKDWLDRATQWFGFKFLIFNPDLAVYTHVILNIWFSPSGELLPGITLTSFDAEPYAAGMTAMACDLIFGLLWAHLFLSTLVGILRAGFQGGLRQHFMIFWTWVEWFSVIGGMVYMGGWLLCLMLLAQIKDAAMQLSMIRPGAIDLWLFVSDAQARQYNIIAQKLHAETSNLAALLMDYRAFLNWYTLLLICRFFRAFEAQPRLAVVTNTISHSLPDMGHFLIVLFSIWFSFAVAGMFLFGHRLLEFAYLHVALHNTGLIILGGWDYEILAEEHPLTAFLWTAAFITLLFLVLMNMALAIVMDIHSEVVSETSNSQELWVQLAQAFVNVCRHRDWLSVGTIIHGVERMPPEEDTIRLVNLVKAVDGLPESQARELIEEVDKLANQEDAGGLSLSDALSMVGWITAAVEQIYDKVDFLQMLEEDSVRMVAAWTKHLPSDSHGPLVFIDFDAHSDSRLQILEKRLGTMADIINENMGYAVQQGRVMQNAIVLIEDLTRGVPRTQIPEAPRWSPGEFGPSRGPPTHGYNSSYSGGVDRSYDHNRSYSRPGNGALQTRADQYGSQRHDPWDLAVRPQSATYDHSHSRSSGFNQAAPRQVMTFNV